MRVSPIARLTTTVVGAIMAALTVGACDGVEKKESPRAAAVAQVRHTLRHNACASRIAYVRLTKYAFDEAIKIRNADPVNLATLAAYSVVRMEAPFVKSHDETLDVTVCSGRFILEVPPGAERGFGGERRLIADIEYAAQPAADGSGLVYHVRGAEPIIYKLAAFDLHAKAFGPPIAGEQARLAWLQKDDTAPLPDDNSQQPLPTKPFQTAYGAKEQIEASPPVKLAVREVPLAGVPQLPLEPKTSAAQARDAKAAATPAAKVVRQAAAAPKLPAKTQAAKRAEVADASASAPPPLPTTKSSAKRDVVAHAAGTAKSTAKPVEQARSAPKAKDKLAQWPEKPAKAAAKPVQLARSEPKAKGKLAQRADKRSEAAAKPVLEAKAQPKRNGKSSRASALAAPPSVKPIGQAAAAGKPKTMREARADRSARTKQLVGAAAEKRTPAPKPKLVREAKAAAAAKGKSGQARAVSPPKPSRLGELQAVLARLEPVEAKRAKPALAKTKAPKPKPIPGQLAQASPTPSSEPAPKPKPSLVQQAAAAPKPAATPLRSAPRSGCSFSGTPSQYLICSHRRLAALDRRTASLMAAAMSDADGWTRAELSRTRNRFISWRDRCRDEACIESAYTDRMAEIREIMADARY